MQGYVKLETSQDNEGNQHISAEVRLVHVGTADKILLMHSLKEALGMSKEEFMLYVLAEDAKVLDEAETSSVRIEIPAEEVPDDES